MRQLVAWLTALTFAVSPAMAGTSGNADKSPSQPAKAAESSAPAAKATGTAKAEAAPKSEASSMELELEQLRDLLQQQTQELQAQGAALREQQQKMQALEDQLKMANARAAEAGFKATEAVNTTAAVKSTADALNTTVADLKASNEVLKTTVATGQTDAAKEEGPATIRYRGINITPGGFVAAETVYRTHATGDGINTQFTGIPYPNNALSRISENQFSGRQSRLSLLLDTKVGTAKVSGYVETDFLGTGVTSNNRQSNSYVLRYRQFWARVAWENGLSVSGGQMWSLVTENKKGIENRQEAFPMQIDPQYIVGWAWQRAYAFRVAKSFGDKFALAAAVEGPQSTFTAHGSGNNFFFNAPGAGGGLFNFVDTTGYTLNESPDFLVKAALDPGWGHYELVGILSPFRSRVYPCGAVPVIVANLPANCAGSGTSVAGAFNDSRVGGGLGFTARLPVVAKKVDLVGHFQGGDGIGRYSSAQLADLTARPNGTLAPIRSAAWLGMLELHPTPKFEFYAYGGGEYDARTAYIFTNAAGHPVGVGYGSPLFNNTCPATEGFPGSSSFSSPTAPGSAGTCTGDVHNVIEGTVGFWHNMYSDSKKGRLRWGIQYSYLTKIGWSGNNTSATTGVAGPSQRPKAVDNMVWTSFRYYLP